MKLSAAAPELWVLFVPLNVTELFAPVAATPTPVVVVMARFEKLIVAPLLALRVSALLVVVLSVCEAPVKRMEPPVLVARLMPSPVSVTLPENVTVPAACDFGPARNGPSWSWRCCRRSSRRTRRH